MDLDLVHAAKSVHPPSVRSLNIPSDMLTGCGRESCVLESCAEHGVPGYQSFNGLAESWFVDRFVQTSEDSLIEVALALFAYAEVEGLDG